MKWILRSIGSSCCTSGTSSRQRRSNGKKRHCRRRSEEDANSGGLDKGSHFSFLDWFTKNSQKSDINTTIRE